MRERLSVGIHVIVILLVVARGHIVEPLLIVKIPADGLFDALLELQTGLPSEFPLQLCAVNRIAEIVSGTVGHEGNQVHILAFLSAQQTIDGLNHHLDDINVLPLVETTDVIGQSRTFSPLP